MILLSASTNRAPPYYSPTHPSILHWKPLCSTVPSPWSNNNIRNHNTSAQSQETYRLLLPTHFFFFCDFKLLKVCFVFKFINTPTRPLLLSQYANQFMLLWILVFPLGQLFVSLSVYLPVCVCLGVSTFQVVYTFRLVTLMVYLISFAAAAHPSYKILVVTLREEETFNTTLFLVSL